MGHGSGDSLLLLLTHPDTPRPKILCGVTSLPGHYERSKARVENLLSSRPNLKDQTQVVLFQGDAVCRPAAISATHPLSASSEYTFDTILALDCAYHFETRFDFLRQCFGRLMPGGRVALADICFEEKPPLITRLLLSLVLRLMPQRNIVTKRAYVQGMEEMGYVDVQLEDITEDVFPGFCEFLEQQELGFRLLAKAVRLLQGWKGRFVLITGEKPN